MYHKKAAGGFTIAEMLITIAIIGVVTTIVIPALLKSTDNTEYKSAWKNGYSDLAQAAKQILADNPTAFTGTYSNTQIRDLFADKLKIIKTCSDNQSIGNCWPSSYKTYSGTVDTSVSNGTGIILVTGESLVFVGSSIYVDTNGLKSPNRWGKDLFLATVSSTGTSVANGDCTETGDGKGCSFTYLYNIGSTATATPCTKPNSMCVSGPASQYTGMSWPSSGTCPNGYSCVTAIGDGYCDASHGSLGVCCRDGTTTTCSGAALEDTTSPYYFCPTGYHCE